MTGNYHMIGTNEIQRHLNRLNPGPMSFSATMKASSDYHYTGDQLLQHLSNQNNLYSSHKDGLEATKHLRDSVYMSPQLVNLTNTLRSKKKCQAGHNGGCQVVTRSQMENDSDVVFRAVSPHGHVYWEIDPKARESSLVTVSDEDERAIQTSSSDMSRTSRQSSSRFSDNHPLISESPQHHVLVNPFIDVQLLSSASATSSPKSNVTEQRFSSLRNNARNHFVSHFGSRKNDSKTVKAKKESGEPIPEQLQQQVQIRDLRSIPVSVKSNDYILAKIQDHMSRGSPVDLVATTAALNEGGKNSPKQRKV